MTAFADNADARCRRALGGATLAEAAQRGNSEAIYACGFGVYHAAGDPLATRSDLMRTVTHGKQPYGQATLDALLAERHRGA